MNEKLQNSPHTWSDPDDAPELTDSFFSKGDWAINGKAASKEQGQREASKQVKRGRPKLENTKVLLSVRYSKEVVDYFKSTGKGWQTRMDEALKEHIAAH